MDKKELLVYIKSLYVDKKMTIREIAQLLDVPKELIANYLEEQGVQKRGVCKKVNTDLLSNTKTKNQKEPSVKKLIKTQVKKPEINTSPINEKKEIVDKIVKVDKVEEVIVIDEDIFPAITKPTKEDAKFYVSPEEKKKYRDDLHGKDGYECLSVEDFVEIMRLMQ